MSGAERNYTVYYHLNKTNGKVYFGITCMKPEERWKKGRGYSGNTHFIRAVKKYGWDGFYHRVLISGVTRKQAELIEQNVIRWSNSTNSKHGYNSKEGGGVTGRHSTETKLRMSKAAIKRHYPPGQKWFGETTMEKPELIKSMQDFVGGRDFICVAHLAEYREISERKAAKLVETLPFIREGRRRDYQIEDVVERLLELRELEG